MKYYPIQNRWQKLKHFYLSSEAAEIWFPEMEAFQESKCEDNNFPFRPKEFTNDLRPRDYDGCDWRLGHRGRQPHYWDFVCHAACHWVVSLHLWVAEQAEPDRDWRIVSANTHSTVWDGEDTLFDGNFLALGVDADEAWELASKQKDSRILPVGELMLHC